MESTPRNILLPWQLPKGAEMTEENKKGQNQTRKRKATKNRIARLRYWCSVYTEKALGLSTSGEASQQQPPVDSAFDGFAFAEHSFGGVQPRTSVATSKRPLHSGSPQGVDALDLAHAIEKLPPSSLLEELPSDALESLLGAEQNKVDEAIAAAVGDFPLDCRGSSCASSVGSLMDVEQKIFDEVFNGVGKMETIACKLSTSSFADVVTTVSAARAPYRRRIPADLSLADD